MQNFVNGISLLCLLCWILAWSEISYGDTFGLDMIHKFSEKSKSIMHRRNGHLSGSWPREGTPNYYKNLLTHDRYRHGSRRLSSSTSGGTSYYMAPTNETIELDVLGGLHYAFVTLGTPNTTYVVALDTGSDLLWLPCECVQCAPTSAPSYGLNVELPVYSPSQSKTSKTVSCTDSLCSSTLSSGCGASQQCDYIVKYSSANTSTSGFLVQDSLYLNSESEAGVSVNTSVYFGCGQVQTGTLVEGVAPDGLLGLGMDNISVPSTLARSELVLNSFSMCFSALDASGRLVFGEKGAADLQKTPFQSDSQTPTLYALQATDMVVNDTPVSVSAGNILFDTGTAITRLTTSWYQSVGAAVNKQVNSFTATNESTTIGFEYCWQLSNTNDILQLPSLSIIFSGGSNLTISSPYEVLVDNTGTIVGACLGIIEYSSAIIGHNFMGGYRFFFDREDMTLSWTLSNCYDLNGTSGSTPQTTTHDAGPTSEQGTQQTSNGPSSSHKRLPLDFLSLLLVFIISISLNIFFT